jgi:sporulation protein YlmC with PRC-barrel domain
MTGLVGSLLLASAAFAAEDSPATTNRTSAAPAAASESSSSFQGNWRVSKVAGLSVYNDSNESIGSINDLLMDKSGSVKAAVISVGGFLGVGARLVAVPYDKIKFVNEPVAYTGASDTPAGTRPASSTTTGSTANPPAPATAPATASKPNPWYPDHAVLNATKDDLQKMTEFKYSE